MYEQDNQPMVAQQQQQYPSYVASAPQLYPDMSGEYQQQQQQPQQPVYTSQPTAVVQSVTVNPAPMVVQTLPLSFIENSNQKTSTLALLIHLLMYPCYILCSWIIGLNLVMYYMLFIAGYLYLGQTRKAGVQAIVQTFSLILSFFAPVGILNLIVFVFIAVEVFHVGKRCEMGNTITHGECGIMAPIYQFSIFKESIIKDVVFDSRNPMYIPPAYKTRNPMIVMQQA